MAADGMQPLTKTHTVREAANMLENNPTALQLCEWDTLKYMASQSGAKTMFVPMHTLKNDAMMPKSSLLLPS
jgi:hypothetical protein